MKGKDSDDTSLEGQGIREREDCEAWDSQHDEEDTSAEDGDVARSDGPVLAAL
jgi:hypothetical protein